MTDRQPLPRQALDELNGFYVRKACTSFMTLLFLVFIGTVPDTKWYAPKFLLNAI